MTEEELKKLKKQISESLASDRHAILMRFPFIGNLLMRMDLIPIRDKRCLTACTDGKRIYFNIAFYTKLNDKERVFVLAHEISHCMLLHLVRCQSRDKQLFNMASDMEVNYMLATQPNKHDIQPPKDVLWPDDCMKGKSAEVIYDYLLKKYKKQWRQALKGQSGQKAQQGNSGSNGFGDQETDEDSSYDDQTQGNGQKNHSGNGKDGKNTGKLEGQFDSHSYGGNTPDDSNGNSESGEGGAGNGKVTDQWGEVGYDSDFKPQVSEDFAEEMREAVIAEAQRTERMKGDMPAGLDGIIKELQKPEIDWREKLSSFVTQCYGDKRSWIPPSRRHVYNEIYFPSHRDEKLKVGCLIDTSGSCWGDLTKFFGELCGLLNSFGKYELDVIQCDADVHRVDHYNAENPFPVDDPKSIDIEGCGGSDFRPAFKYIRENAMEFDCLVGFTDGYIDAPKNDPGYPVLWVLTKDGCEDFCDFGQKMKFKHNSYDDGDYSSLSC